MRYGICKLSVVPMRKEKSHESELVSELLYNDIYEVSEDCQEWLKIKSLFDSYEGWIRSIQHSELDESEFNEILSKENIELLQKIENISQKTIREKLLTYLSNEARKNKSNIFAF